MAIYQNLDSYRNEEDMLESGMEVALIPPVGGG